MNLRPLTLLCASLLLAAATLPAQAPPTPVAPPATASAQTPSSGALPFARANRCDRNHIIAPCAGLSFSHLVLPRAECAHRHAAATTGRHGIVRTLAESNRSALQNPADSAILRCWVV
jgi:hypothetical protein